MKWFKDLDDDLKFMVTYGGIVLIGLTLLGIYRLVEKLIDKL